MAEDLKLEDWYYRGEGHCSLVVAHTEKNVVIRLLKRKKQEKNNSSVTAKQTDGTQQLQQLQRGTEYVKHVIQPLLGEHFVQYGVPINLNASFLEEINKKVEQQRPAHRLGKEVDPDCLLGIKLPDFCHVSSQVSNCDIPTFCIEIKAKCGFCPSSDIVPAVRAVKSRVCAYCMYQHLKLKLGKWPERSGYCPVDLFSGNPARMKYALKALFKTPQNNLRLFKNGEVLLSEEVREDYLEHLKTFFRSHEEGTKGHREGTEGHGEGSESHGEGGDKNGTDNKDCVIETLQDFIVDCLLHVPDIQKNGEGVHHSEQPDKLPVQTSVQYCEGSGYCREKENNNGETASQGLPFGCVLQRLLAIQKLDDLGIEGIWSLYEQVVKHFASCSQNRTKSYIDGPYEHFWKKQAPSNNCITDELDVDHCLHKVKEYMVSRTAKDCSVMVAFRPLQNGENCCEGLPFQVLTDRHGNRFQMSIAVIDLDAKPIEKFTTYLEDDRAIVEYYMKVLEAQNGVQKE